METARILIVDDERSLREMAQLMLTRAGYDVTLAEHVPHALAILEEHGERSFDLVLSDLQMPGGSGIDVLKASKRYDPSTQIVLMTAHASIATAVEAMKAGAYDYLEKPFKRAELLALLEKALEKRRLLQENFLLKRELAGKTSFDQMVGSSPAMQKLFEMVRRAAPARTTVLITGESGTGKELVARAFHNKSNRKDKPFIAVNCGAIPESLIESELFGHVKGAFTGAQRDRIGYFVAAEGGTLFLDEVGEIPLHIQVKLLRVLQERVVQPVGCVKASPVDVRIVAATNRDLRQEVAERRFREDLFYRLNVIQLQVPPLRERRDDLRLLIQHFLDKYNEEHGKQINGIEGDAFELLIRYHYPGNVRELENIIERAVTLELTEMISTEVLPYFMIQKESFNQLTNGLEIPDEGMNLEEMVAQLERSLLLKALAKTGGHRTEAARVLGISFRSIRYRLDKYNIDVEASN